MTTPVNKTVTELFDLINKQRAKNLEQDAGLTKLAQKHANFMAAADRLVHSSEPYPEIICYQSGLDAQWALDIWMNSPPHRQILTAAYTRIGLAHSTNKRHKRTYWCAMFQGGIHRKFPRL